MILTKTSSLEQVKYDRIWILIGHNRRSPVHVSLLLLLDASTRVGLVDAFEQPRTYQVQLLPDLSTHGRSDVTDDQNSHMVELAVQQLAEQQQAMMADPR